MAVQVHPVVTGASDRRWLGLCNGALSCQSPGLAGQSFGSGVVGLRTGDSLLRGICLLRLSQPSNASQPVLSKACSLWAIQMGLAMPLFVTTVDDGRMMAMTFCSGLAYLLLFRTPDPAARATVVLRSDRLRPAAWLALLELWLLPSHCCTYSVKQIIGFVPYAAASQWKALLLDWLAVVPASLPR